MLSDPRLIGTRGEAAVAEYLAERGFTIVARNARVGRLEIDLIGRRDGLLVFCEVKTAAAGSAFGAAERLGTAQQARLRRAATQWLRQNPDQRAFEVRFDAAFVALASQEPPYVEYFRGAF